MSRVTVPPPRDGQRDTRARQAARENLIQVLWDERGQRRLPAEKKLVEALTACTPHDVWWVCEAASAGPLYLLPTGPWITVMARWLEKAGAQKVLEVGAGDGFLTTCLEHACPRIHFVATDTGAWSKPARRMTPQDHAEFPGVPFAGIPMGAAVQRMGAAAAVKAYKPDVVLVSWAPPGLLVEKVIQAPSQAVLEIGVEGDVCGNGMATWRFNKEFLDGPLEDRALCRLDARPLNARATRVTLYFGRAHPDFGQD